MGTVRLYADNGRVGLYILRNADGIERLVEDGRRLVHDLDGHRGGGLLRLFTWKQQNRHLTNADLSYF